MGFKFPAKRKIDKYLCNSGEPWPDPAALRDPRASKRDLLINQLLILGGNPIYFQQVVAFSGATQERQPRVS
jgi:hypothetical protein